MGWSNPDIPWRELREKMLGTPPKDPHGDAPISRRKRLKAVDIELPMGPSFPYAELHAHSHFSFLDGASSPQMLVVEAIRLGLSGLAITDHDGFYGAPQMAEAGRGFEARFARTSTSGVSARTSTSGVSARTSTSGFQTVYGAELSLGLSGPQNGVPDPEGRHLLVLARGVEGYHRLAGAITDAMLRGDEKGRPVYDLDELAERAEGRLLVLTGCRKGFRTLDDVTHLVERFGADNVVVELTSQGLPSDAQQHADLDEVARRLRLATVATGNVHYARPRDARLADAMAAIRARRNLAELDGWRPPPTSYLRSGAEMLRLFPRHRDAVMRSAAIADECGFDLQKARPELPMRMVPEGMEPIDYLRQETWRHFEDVYGEKAHRDAARERIEHELGVIERKHFAGYFLIVHDIVRFARSKGILCQGRGSAAASAVCFVLGITAIDPVLYRLPFSRFISEDRTEEPDIDVDFDSDRREEVIQWVYDTHGRRNAAQVANVVSYRPKMALRDAAKALGYSVGQQDAWSKQMRSWFEIEEPEGVPQQVLDLARELHQAPRHLGIHSGGMVLTKRPVGEVVPIERARMDKRTVLQWDKDACEFMGLVKFDLLGLGMLSALDHMMRLAAEHLGEHWTLATLPKEEPAVYDMLCRADSVGVFQVESRAQIGTLPRLRPRCFYDLTIEIALIRPGPIQGGAVHPYIDRKTGREPVTFVHPDLAPEEVLGRTLGVPLFQEQIIAMGKALGDLDDDEADTLRRAMGSKRGIERIESLETQLFEGMRARGLTEEQAQGIYQQIQAFAHFGFAESHSLSFALLVYASSWFKLHYPAAFLAGLLRAQPMGFYSPQSLIQDARRHGVEVLGPSLLHSGASAVLESVGEARRGLDQCLYDGPADPTPYLPDMPDPTPWHRRDGSLAVRLGLDAVKGIGSDLAERIVHARAERPFTSMRDLSRRAGLETRQLEALATAGVFEDAFGAQSPRGRREALWQAGWAEREEHLEGMRLEAEQPAFPAMAPVETMLADLWSTSTTPGDHPYAHIRSRLRSYGIPTVAELSSYKTGQVLTVAGFVTHRQHPGTANGVTFLNLEDETGMLNVVVNGEVWSKHRQIALSVSAMLVQGRLERSGGATNLIALRLGRLSQIAPDAAQALEARHRSRDFR